MFRERVAEAKPNAYQHSRRIFSDRVADFFLFLKKVFRHMGNITEYGSICKDRTVLIAQMT